MGVGAAIAGATAIGSIGSSLLSSGAASSAAGQQSAAAQQATAASQAEAAQTRADLLPYNQIGQQGAEQLASLEGLNGSGNQSSAFKGYGLSGLTFQPTQAQLAATPGYQWNLAQGQQAVANSNAAQGRGISGAALKGAANYATGLASNTLGQQQQIFQSNLANVLGPLSNLSTQGENAAAQTGQLGTSNVNSANQAAIGGANASAAGTVGSANALSGGLSALGSAPTNYLLYNQLLGGGSNAAFSSAASSSPFNEGGSLVNYPL